VDLPDYYFGVGTSWELDLWGKLKSRKKAAVARFFQSSETRNLVITNLVSETATAYYELAAADQELKVLDQTIRLQEQAIEMVKVQKEAAVVNELAVQQFEAQLLNMRSFRTEIQQTIIDLETRINMLAGRHYCPIRRDTLFFDENALPELSIGKPVALLSNRPDIREAEWEIEAAKGDLRAARAAFLPSFAINGTIGFQAYRPGLWVMYPGSLAYSLIGSLSAPILNRNQLKGEFEKADAMQLAAIYQYRKAVTTGMNEVFREYSNTINLGQLYQLKLKESAILSKSILTAAELFRTGRADYLEVLFARQNALRTNIDMILARRNQFLAAINLYKALGGGWRN
jgi:NodT family efflux transporter outer membrane factor (OMF) lipoprotein